MEELNIDVTKIFEIGAKLVTDLAEIELQKEQIRNNGKKRKPKLKTKRVYYQTAKLENNYKRLKGGK